jgi:hypothetical protein
MDEITTSNIFEDVDYHRSKITAEEMDYLFLRLKVFEGLSEEDIQECCWLKLPR